MRLEAIEKEAELFQGEREAYVHIEKTENSDVKCVINGGRAGLSLAAYILMLSVSEKIGTKPLSLLKFYKQMWRKHGNINHS